MGGLVDTTEMYLRLVYELQEDGVVPLRVRIAERLGQSGPTVSQTVARMERKGLIVVMWDRRLVLTERGWAKAVSVMRKHRLSELFLVDVIGLEWELAHTEACRWEHVMSDAVEHKLITLLDDPRVSPYGNPIPEPNAAPGVVGAVPVSVAEIAADGGEATVSRIGEYLQRDVELLKRLWTLAVVPSRKVRAGVYGAHGVTVDTDSGSIVLTMAQARSLFVSV